MPVSSRTPAQPHSDDETQARSWARRVRHACEELFGDPFNDDARAAMVDVLVRQGPDADAALMRALAKTCPNL
ncbi:hypothetical protein [Mycobacteroides abscessus]|uniref:hypothetical protein n=1 Tax=Mycobacteroides abscessus TaxID=36809 RepID=UPI0009A578E0|nr:hypothetical protein [Mycobacteroides abscessus]SLH38824.1 Uncharacterised protein [Mycobacteroides abscessus subsp. massiliense]